MKTADGRTLCDANEEPACPFCGTTELVVEEMSEMEHGGEYFLLTCRDCSVTLEAEHDTETLEIWSKE